MIFDVGHDFLAVHALAAGHEEAEPAGTGVRAGLGQDELVLGRLQRLLQVVEVMTATLHEARELLQLGAAHSGLHVRDVEVQAEMRIDVFMVVAFRQFAVLAIETVAAVVVLAGVADAVAAPITERTHNFVEQRIVRVDGAALAHRHMMRRVEAGRANIADGTRELLLAIDDVARAEGIAVILHEPEIVLVAEVLHGLQVKGIAQRMREHDGLRLVREGRLQLRDVDVVLRNRHIDEDRHRTVVHDG